MPGNGVRDALVKVLCQEAGIKSSEESLIHLFNQAEDSPLIRNLMGTLVSDAEHRGDLSARLKR